MFPAFPRLCNPAVEVFLVEVLSKVIGVEVDVKVVGAEVVAKVVRESNLDDEVVGDPANLN